MTFPDEKTLVSTSIMKLKSPLLDLIEPDFGLLEHLLRLDVLTHREYNNVRYEKGAPYKRNEALLNMLTSEDQCNKFLEALCLNGQQHVFNFIAQKGGQKRSFNARR